MAILSFILEKGGSLMLESEFQNKLIQELKKIVQRLHCNKTGFKPHSGNS